MLSTACGTIAKLRRGVLSPPGVVTEMLAVVFVVVPTAAGGMTRVALIEVGERRVAPESVMPPVRFSVAPSKPVPARITGTDEAAGTSDGVMLVSVGSGAAMVNASGVRVLAPLGVVTVTLTGPSAAVGGMIKFATLVVPSLAVMDATISGP